MTRAQWQMPSGPARSIVRWIEAAGSVVLMADIGNRRVDGLSQWTADHPVIVINVANPTDRIRWTLAHEVGHLVLHREDATDDMEHEADAFAAEFLMPEVLIRSELTNLTLGKAVDLKREWGVSVAALIQRAHQLGVLSGPRRASLFKQLSARGWRVREPASDEITPEKAELLAQINTHLRSRGLDDTEVAELAGYRSPDTNRLMPPRSRPLHAVPD
jgi:Zn-dependent peptidase ImmA (M78 family)